MFSDAELAAAAGPGPAVLAGHNTNEGFFALMRFLTRQFPSQQLSTQGFSQEMFSTMVGKMFPATDTQVINTNIFSGDCVRDNHEWLVLPFWLIE